MLIVALVYWEIVINNLVSFWNVKNLKYKKQKQQSIGFLKKRDYEFFLFFKKRKNQKTKTLKMGRVIEKH